MPFGLWVVVAWTLFVMLTAIAFVAWAWSEGYLRDIEEPKYTMLEEREPEPWRGRGGDVG